MQVRTRGRKPSEPRAIVAAATRIKLSDKKLAKKQAARRQDWQEDAWLYFDLFGFVKQSLWLLGNSMAKARMFVAVQNPTDGNPIPVTDPASGVPAAVAEQCVHELARLRGPLGGMSEILRELDMNLEIAGEGYLVGVGAREEVIDERGVVVQAASDESWQVRSTSEVDVTGDGVYKVRDDPGGSRQGTALDPERDTCIRFWLPHPRFSSLPDSAIRGELEDLETLLILSRQRRAEGKSRLPSGLLLIDAEITASSPVATQQDDGGNSGTGDVVLDKISDAIASAIEDESSAAGLAPVMLRVSVPAGARVADMVAKVDLSRTSDQWLDVRIDKLVESVARGTNLPVESTMGHQSTTFANAEQIDEDKFYDHVEPRLLLIADLLSVAFLRPQLLAEDENGVAPPAEFVQWAPQVFVWYDASALLSKPDTGAHADAAYDRNEISGDAYRAAKGFGEDDAPDALELLIRTGLRRGILTGDLTKALLDLLGLDIPYVPLAKAAPGVFDDNGDAVPKEVPSGDVVPSNASRAQFLALAELLMARERSAVQPDAIAASSKPAPKALTRGALDVGRKLMDLDRELRSRLLVLTSAAMQSALKTAGNRARQAMPEARALTRNLRPCDVLSTLGQSLVAASNVDEGKLLDGAFDEIEDSFISWGATAQRDALDLAAEVGTGLTTAQRDEYALRQAADLTEAWAWLKEQLVTLAHLRLYDPHPAAPAIGEFDPTSSVPASMIRQAVTRAGGTIGVQTSGAGDAWVALRNAGTEPAGGIGTGEVLREALNVAGTSIEGYRWVYGPAARAHPFEEHEALDGQVVDNFDNAEWTADQSWTSFGFYFPGDHAGCVAAGTVVDAPGMSAATLRWYEGTLIDLDTASGEHLAITPNHPVLTERGWVPAGQLVEGDNLVRCVDAHGAARLVPHDDERPTRIEELVAARWVSSKVIARGVPVAAEHFHGDGLGGEVCVVLADSDLRSDGHPSLDEPTREHTFGSVSKLADGLAGASRAFEGLAAVRPPTFGLEGVSGDSSAFVECASVVEQPLSLRRAAWRDPDRPESLDDRVAIHATTLAQCQNGLSGFVEFDKLVHVDQRSGFAGHVFNLHTDQQWYVASGIIVHNCLCDIEPVVVDVSALADQQA